MDCPTCQEKTDVIDSRATSGSGPFANYIRRRRQCSGCGRRFSTREVPIGEPIEIRLTGPAGAIILGHGGSVKLDLGMAKAQIDKPKASDWKEWERDPDWELEGDDFGTDESEGSDV